LKRDLYSIESVIIGDCIVDLVEKNGEITWHAGGAGLNLAVGLARLGNTANLVAQIGLDANGMRLMRHLHDEKVRILPCPNVDYTGIATSSRSHGEPVYHFNAPMQRRRIFPNERIITTLHQAGAVAISSFAYDRSDQIGAFYDALQHRQGKLFVDPNPRPSLVRDMEAFRQGFEHIATIADFVKLSDEDIKIFYGMAANHADIAAHLSVLGVKFCLITQGEKGASLYVEGRQAVHVDIWPDPRPIIDTMGAGDATFAAFIHFIICHGTPNNAEAWHECLTAAMKIAAATCRAFGGGLQTFL